MNTVPNSQKQRPFWAKDREETLHARIQKINKLNDPTTNADEILRYGKWILYALLAYSTLLGFFYYYKSFSKSFPFEIAVFFSVILPVAIEFGKNYCATWAVRQPFFHGFPSIFASKAKTFIFAGLVLIAIVTYAMSIRNSTVGAQQLSLMFSHERNAVAFVPDTRVIDEQIAATQSSINDTRNIKWKGVVTYQAQKSIQSQTKALSTLQSQREEAIRQQRQDWEQDQTYKSDQGNNIAGLVLASGGFIELLQLLFQILRVACEKLLDNRLPHPTPATRQQQQTPTFSSFPQNNASPLFFFNRNLDGNVQSANDHHDPDINGVSQSTQGVTQYFDPGAVNFSDDVLKTAETDLRRHHANFGRKQGKDATTSENINRILDETYQKISQPGFSPSRGAALRFYGYLAGLFTSLDEKGRPYERSTSMAQYCLKMIPERDPVA